MELQATSEPVPRVVFDAVIFVQAFLSSTGPAYAALLACAEGEAILYACEAILEEVRNVSERPFLRKRFPDNWSERIDSVMELYQIAGRTVADAPTMFHLPRDPKDEPYLNLAIAVNAKYLVSRDKDLLALMTDESPEATEFRRLYPNITVLDPASFLRALAH